MPVSGDVERRGAVHGVRLGRHFHDAQRVGDARVCGAGSHGLGAGGGLCGRWWAGGHHHQTGQSLVGAPTLENGKPRVVPAWWQFYDAAARVWTTAVEPFPPACVSQDAVQALCAISRLFPILGPLELFKTNSRGSGHTQRVPVQATCISRVTTRRPQI